MEKNTFWEMIENARQNGHFEVEVLLDTLAKRSVEDIYAFEDNLTDCLYALDTMECAKAVGYQENEYFSPDVFLYTRVNTVEQGRDFYNRVCKEPETMPQETSESLLQAARTAYQRKTKQQDWEYIPKRLYETYFNRKGWGEEKDMSIEEFLERGV